MADGWVVIVATAYVVIALWCLGMAVWRWRKRTD